MAKLTLSAQVEALTAQVAALVAAQAPATAAPAKGKAKFGDTEFGAAVLAKPRKACAIPSHGKSCNRTFSANSSGDVNHIARID